MKYSKKIKEIMKTVGFKNRGDIYYKHIADKLIMISFCLNKRNLFSIIDYKQYSYDDIYWRILGREDLLKKSDAERVFGAYHISTLRLKFYQDVIDDEINVERVICDRIQFIQDHDIIALVETDINKNILDGDYSTKLKCLALLDSNRIDEALDLAAESCNSGDSGGIMYNGMSFFQLLLDKSQNNRSFLTYEEK